MKHRAFRTKRVIAVFLGFDESDLKVHGAVLMLSLMLGSKLFSNFILKVLFIGVINLIGYLVWTKLKDEIPPKYFVHRKAWTASPDLLLIGQDPNPIPLVIQFEHQTNTKPLDEYDPVPLGSPSFQHSA